MVQVTWRTPSSSSQLFISPSLGQFALTLVTPEPGFRGDEQLEQLTDLLQPVIQSLIYLMVVLVVRSFPGPPGVCSRVERVTVRDVGR